jgi:predicted nucleic acid-binding protein
LRLVAARRLVPLVSTALFLEYEDVLSRPEQRAVHGLDLAAVSQAMNGLAALCEAVEVRFNWRPQLSDANDEMVLEVALNGRADCIVTHNLRDFRVVAPRFGLAVLTPGALLERIGR